MGSVAKEMQVASIEQTARDDPATRHTHLGCFFPNIFFAVIIIFCERNWLEIPDRFR